MAQIDQIEIHTGNVDFPFKRVRALEVKCEATNALMPAPTIDEANGRLRALAASVGANAIINVEYKSGVSFTSWKSLKATGIAVIRESDEMACPQCAEQIKRAALKCRYCGYDLPRQDPANVAEEAAALSGPAGRNSAVTSEEPLRDNNNPAILLGLIFLGLVILSAIVSAASN